MMKNKIDISKWKNFKIEDVFELEKKSNKKQVPTGNSIKKRYLDEKGNIPVISVTGINNGICGYIKEENENIKNHKIFNNIITVSFLGTVFYQKSKCILDMKVHCLKPKDIELNLYIGLFLIGVINTSLKKYTYSDQISSSVLPELNLKLPVDSMGNLDWNYMENYMIQQEKKAKEVLEGLINCKDDSNKIDITEWGEFHLYDIFDINSGSKMDKIAMKFDNPTINFVGRSGVNNGVTAVVDEVEDYVPYKAGNLTLALGGAYLGSCFVQEKDFYTSQNVVVLSPKEDISFYAKEFICAVIFKEGNTHYKAFIDELNRHIKTDFIIKLPVDSKGKPNYEYMDKYMAQIKNTVTNKYKVLKSN